MGSVGERVRGTSVKRPLQPLLCGECQLWCQDQDELQIHLAFSHLGLTLEAYHTILYYWLPPPCAFCGDRIGSLYEMKKHAVLKHPWGRLREWVQQALEVWRETVRLPSPGSLSELTKNPQNVSS